MIEAVCQECLMPWQGSRLILPTGRSFATNLLSWSHEHIIWSQFFFFTRTLSKNGRSLEPCLVFLAVNAHSHTIHQDPFTEVNVVKETFWKPFTNRTTDVKYKQNTFWIKEDFHLKDGQTDYLFKQSMKTEERERFHLERVEALLFVAAIVYKSSW